MDQRIQDYLKKRKSNDMKEMAQELFINSDIYDKQYLPHKLVGHGKDQNGKEWTFSLKEPCQYKIGDKLPVNSKNGTVTVELTRVEYIDESHSSGFYPGDGFTEYDENLRINKRYVKKPVTLTEEEYETLTAEFYGNFDNRFKRGITENIRRLSNDIRIIKGILLFYLICSILGVVIILFSLFL